jgi:hypothetical protein
MADNTAKARKDLEGARKAVAEHIEKYNRYPAQQDKDTALKTIKNAQGRIRKIKDDHPSLRNNEREDNWTP